MNKTDKLNAESLAKAHAEWFSETIKKIYEDAFKHGFGHGLEYYEKNKMKDE